MATTPNQKPVPSEDYANMRFNAGKFDEFMTSTASSYVDRLGITHLTVTGIQASVTGALLPANNLSDVQSAATSRTNLGLGTVATENIVPIAKGGTGSGNAPGARASLAAATRGANSDITSLTGLTTPLSTAQGGTGNTTGLAATATALATSRTFITNLASTSAAGFTGTANNSHGVTGTLPISNGGTGATTAAAALTSIGAKANAGVTDASSAASGVVGEVISSTGAGVAMTSGTFYDVATITLTAGDWELSSVASLATTTSSVFTIIQLGTSTTTATLPALPYRTQLPVGATSADVHTVAPMRRVNISTTTTFYLVSRVVYTVGSVTGTGYLEARRVR